MLVYAEFTSPMTELMGDSRRLTSSDALIEMPRALGVSVAEERVLRRPRQARVKRGRGSFMI